MSNNPFESPQNPTTEMPVASSQVNPSKTKLPGAMMTIAVICIILGIFGLGGVCTGGFFLAAQGFFEALIEDLPGQTVADKEFQRINMDAHDGAFVPAIIMLVANLFVATMLIVGSIGCLQRKAGGRSVLNFALLAAIFYSILKIGMTAWSYFASTDAINQAIANYDGEAEQKALELVAQTNSVFTMIGIIVSLVIGLVLLVFYVWAKFHVGSDKTVEYFEAQ